MTYVFKLRLDNIINNYYQLLVNSAYYYKHNQADAKSAVHEAILLLYKYYDFNKLYNIFQNKPDIEIIMYLRAVVRGRCKTKKSFIHYTDYIVDPVDEIEEPILNELENLIEKRSIQYLMNDLCESIKNLSFFQRYLYIEHFQKGLPILKISKELGVPNTTVWKEYRKMKDILKHRLKILKTNI